MNHSTTRLVASSGEKIAYKAYEMHKNKEWSKKPPNNKKPSNQLR